MKQERNEKEDNSIPIQEASRNLEINRESANNNIASNKAFNENNNSDLNNENKPTKITVTKK